jgi:glycerol-3-phosphate cytidylyltransferase
MDLENINRLRQDNVKIGFTCSCFDLFHAGHYLMLKDAKEQCEFLIVGLQTDPTIDEKYRVETGGKNKNKPIQSFEERKIQVEGCKYVDLIVEYSTEQSLYDILKEIKPDVRILGSDWKDKNYTGCDLGTPIHWHTRNHNYSTSNLRKRVYDEEASVTSESSVTSSARNN